MSGIKITRLDSNSDQNGTYQIIAALPTDQEVNGHTIYVVTGYNETVREYATWAMSWNYTESGESKRSYYKAYSNGHYKSFTLTTPNARELALQDMVTRAGIGMVPAATDKTDTTPPKPSHLPVLDSWEISVNWPAQYSSGLYYLTSAQQRTIYDDIRNERKIWAIKNWRQYAGTTVSPDGKRQMPKMGLLETKTAVEAVTARFRSIFIEGTKTPESNPYDYDSDQSEPYDRYMD